MAHMTNQAPILPPVSRNMVGRPSPPILNGSSVPPAAATATATTKSKMCNKFNTTEGCKFGDKCHFAHGEWELGRPIAPSHDDPRAMGGSIPSRFGGRIEPPPPPPTGSNFGASATAKISVDASLAGAIIGKGGVNSKQICRQTGAKLTIREHDSDPNLRNIELEGTFEQIKEASAMVRELIVNISAMSGRHAKSTAMPGGASNFKTKLCDNFTKGSCSFGDRCHFAHGAGELRKSTI